MDTLNKETNVLHVQCNDSVVDAESEVGDNEVYRLFAVGMVSKRVEEPTPEFQIQQEDFPALPGSSSEYRGGGGGQGREGGRG